MTTFPDGFEAGMRLTPARLNARNSRFVEQGIDQEVVSSTTLVDSNIVVPVVANARYRFLLRVSYGSDAAGLFKSAWTGPSGTTAARFLQGANFTDDAQDARMVVRVRSIGTEQLIGGIIDFAYYSEDIDVQVGGTAGNMVYQFAQLTSSANATTLRAATHVDYHRIA